MTYFRDYSRREFVTRSGVGLGGAWIALQLPAIEAAARYAWSAFQSGAPLRVLTPAEAATLEAIASLIIPTDETPGAREAGVVHFMDRAFETFAAPQLELVRAGMRDLETRAPGFASLPTDRQAASLKEIEQTPFFGATHFLTVAGMFANPAHGGNRDHVGWELLGFEMRPAYQPPFGHYDREARDAGR